MKKTLFTLATVLCMMACGTKSAETTATADETAAAQQSSGEIVYVQVEAVLAQCDLYKTEGVALKRRPKRHRKAGPSANGTSKPKPPSCRKSTRKG